MSPSGEYIASSSATGVTCSYLPPTLYEHLGNFENIPNIYLLYWSCGGIMLIVTAILIVPRWIEFVKAGIRIRDEHNLILAPFSLVAYSIIVIFPLFASFLQFFTFLSPISVFTVEFVIHSMESVVLWFFSKLLIMYLGSLENAMSALKTSTPRKFYAVAPCGCCLKPCVAPGNMRHADFRRLYLFVLQFLILCPIFSYYHLLFTFLNDSLISWLTIAAYLSSSFLCVYGVFSIMTAAHSILAQHKIHGKFWCIKLLVIVMVFPPLIVKVIGAEHFDAYLVPASNERYHTDVIVEAWVALFEMLCFVILAFVWRRYFHPTDAINAHKNSEHKNHDIRYSRVGTMGIGKQKNELQHSSDEEAGVFDEGTVDEPIELERWMTSAHVSIIVETNDTYVQPPLVGMASTRL